MNARRITILLLILLCILSVSLSFWQRHKMRKTEVLAFEPLEINCDTLKEKAERKFSEKNAKIEDSKAWMKARCQWIFLSIATNENDREKMLEHHSGLSANNDELSLAFGVGASYYLGEAIFEDFLILINEASGERSNELLNTCENLMGESIDRSFRSVKTFFEIAQTEGFLDESGKIRQESLCTVHLLFRQTWISTLGAAFDSELRMTHEEKQLILRWQVEASQMSLEKKLAILEKNKQIYPDLYDYIHAQAVLLKNSGNIEGAREFLQKNLEKERSLNEKERVKQIELWLQSLHP